MAKSASLSVEHAWNSVALEERIELISRAHGEGIVAAIAFIALMGSAAYGFDQIWILFGSFFGSMLVVPLFSSYCWRRGKPELILKYLAARSIARRYAYGCSITDLDIILIFRGFIEETFRNQEEELLRKSSESIDLDSPGKEIKEVWICLMRGGVVTMSERSGGAKLEFVSTIERDMTCKKATTQDDAPEGALAITGTGQHRNRRILLWSNYPAAQYVFERKLLKLIEEAPE